MFTPCFLLHQESFVLIILPLCTFPSLPFHLTFVSSPHILPFSKRSTKNTTQHFSSITSTLVYHHHPLSPQSSFLHHPHSSRPTLVYRPDTQNSHTHHFIHLDAGRKQSKQSALAKFVMHSLLGLSPSSSPALSSSPAAPTSAPESDSLPPTSDPSSHSHNYAVLPPPTIDDDHLPPPSNQPSSLAVALRAMNDLTETPTYARSVTSTAPSSPRM